jgi:hypothetical protein
MTMNLQEQSLDCGFVEHWRSSCNFKISFECPKFPSRHLKTLMSLSGKCVDSSSEFEHAANFCAMFDKKNFHAGR